MKVEQALKNIFTSGSINAYNLKKPEKCKLPVIIYKRIGRNKISRNFSNTGDLESLLIRFSVLGDNYSETVNLNQQLENLLDGNKTSFENCLLVGGNENYVEDTKLNDLVSDYEIINKI
jgi:hypothetical protein